MAIKYSTWIMRKWRYRKAVFEVVVLSSVSGCRVCISLGEAESGLCRGSPGGPASPAPHPAWKWTPVHHWCPLPQTAPSFIFCRAGTLRVRLGCSICLLAVAFYSMSWNRTNLGISPLIWSTAEYSDWYKRLPFYSKWSRLSVSYLVNWLVSFIKLSKLSQMVCYTEPSGKLRSETVWNKEWSLKGYLAGDWINHLSSPSIADQFQPITSTAMWCSRREMLVLELMRRRSETSFPQRKVFSLHVMSSSCDLMPQQRLRQQICTLVAAFAAL